MTRRTRAVLARIGASRSGESGNASAADPTWMPGLLTLLVVSGIALRIWPYAANTSLFLDEILVASNIIGLPLIDLVTKPLALDQVAPGGFLFLEKLSVLLLGPSEFALRLVPLLFSIAGVVLFRRLAQRTLRDMAVPLAVALFAIGLPFIRYAAEAKQYGIDATVAIALTLLALNAVERDLSNRRLLLIGASGMLMVWFSQAAVLVMAGIGAALAVHWLVARDARVWRALVFIVPIWALASGTAVLAGMSSMTPSTREFMADFWSLGFPPSPLAPSSAAAWAWTQALSLFDDPTLLRYRWPMMFLALAAVGMVAVARTRPLVASLLVAPALVCMFAAIAHQYPFRGRLLLSLLPGLLLTVAAGTGAVAGAASRLHPSVAALVLVGVLWWPLAALLQSPPPYDLERHREVLGYLQIHRQPGDAIHVFPLTRIGVLFYGTQYGLTAAEWTTGVCDRNDTRAYLRDLDRYRGRNRVWLVWSTARPFRTARAAMEQYLLTIGSKRQSLDMMSPTLGVVSAALYDLSDPVRLASANADSFPAPPMPTDPRPGCRRWTEATATLSVR